MAQIVLSSQDLLAYSSQIRSLNQEVQSVFQDIVAAMNRVQSNWSSPAGAALMQQFNALRPSFDTYVSILDSYAQYLNQTGILYQENESALSASYGS